MNAAQCPVDPLDEPPSRPGPPLESSGAAARSAAVRPRHTPRRTVINYWVDALLLVLFVALLFASSVLQFVFPRGERAYHCRLWGGDYLFWCDLQFGLLATLALGVLLHLMLHWNWICCVTSSHLLRRAPGQDDGTRTLYGVALLMLILHVLGIGLLLAWWSLELAV